MKKSELMAMIRLTSSNAELLSEYDELTDHMISADLEAIQQVLLKRQSLLDEIDINRKRTSEIVDRQSEQEKTLLNSLLQGAASESNLTSPEMRELYTKLRTMRSAWESIAKKDKLVSGSLDKQMAELKGEFTVTQNDRKLIKYYNAVSVAKKTGNNFNSST